MNKSLLPRTPGGVLLAAFTLLSPLAMAQSATDAETASERATAEIRRGIQPSEAGTIPAAPPEPFVPEATGELLPTQPQGFVGQPASRRSAEAGLDAAPGIWETQPGNVVTPPQAAQQSDTPPTGNP